VRPLAILVALAVAGLVAATVVSVPSRSVAAPYRSTTHPAASHPGTPYRVLQMNLCSSGTADCYSQADHDAAVDEAAGQIADRDPAAVTLNEACSADAADLARRTGYRVRFAAVRVAGAPLPCVAPRHRGVFGLAVLTRDAVRSSRDQAFAAHAGSEARRWICATTSRATVCTAHLGTRGSAAERRANDSECAELRGVLARYDEAGTTVFGGDTNRRTPCAPAGMWARSDASASHLPGIQHVYGGRSLTDPRARVAAATYTDHDFLAVTGRL
jgi:endonuclease/exonuclease/phosphatase family metal-dependent hydrolase